MIGIQHSVAHFVHDGWEHTLVHVGAQVSVDIGKVLNGRTAEDTKGDIDHLQICGKQKIKIK